MTSSSKRSSPHRPRRPEAAAVEQQCLQDLASRADDIEYLVQEGTLADTVPCQGDEAARAELGHRGSWDLAVVDAWSAHALVDHYTDSAARTEAVGLLPREVTVQTALLDVLLGLNPAAGADQLWFAARLAHADPHATAQLATFLCKASPVQLSRWQVATLT